MPQDVGHHVTSKAQLSSVQMQLNEASMAQKIEGSIRVSAGTMRNVISLIRIPELAITMQELSRELIKAGIIEELVGENLHANSPTELQEEASEEEVDNVLPEILKDRIATTGRLSTALIAPGSIVAAPLGEEEEEVEEDIDVMMGDMRTKLEALGS
ncbi:Vacuolar protein-sorting-associated protein 24 [Metarhizium acridum]|uniref:Vacuolar protein-sorting-associated protein 24 n=1 Tax=Metarhizium acridum TaxID=92637 RepID=UPI001C6CFF1B|nr:Vacuolar protein-sorting-associated protein 24 [Metarhizium acridum]